MRPQDVCCASARPLTPALNSMIRTLLRAIVLSAVSTALGACGNGERSGAASDAKVLSTDVHVSVAQHALVLPFVALDDYAHRKKSFSLDQRGDRKRAESASDKFLRDSADPKNPLPLNSLSVVVRTYGWSDADMGRRRACSLLTREWARSTCDNPWAAVQQALPVNRFRLVDLSRLRVGDPRGFARCRDDGKPPRPLPRGVGEAVMVCTAMVYGGREDQFHYAVVRIDGNLGALWTVWRYGKNGETAEAMTEREGKAIAAFVRYAIAEAEDWQALHAAMCRLRRPGAVDGPKGADCR